MAKGEGLQPQGTLLDAIATAVYRIFGATTKVAVDAVTHAEPLAQRTLHRLLGEIFVEYLDPHNTLWGNPEARETAVRSGGSSLMAGVQNFVTDLVHNDGYPALTDLSQFKVGETLAATPGTVVYRNELVELIHYTPVTESVAEAPLLIVPPPINKYYILDLAPSRSLVEKAVASGQSVYMISWVNPRKEQKDVEFINGYVLNGVMAAMDFIDRPVALAGLCLGGTLASMAAAYDGATHSNRVKSLSLIVTLTDFSLDTGVMGAMIDQQLVDTVYARTQQRGVLTEKEMGNGWVGMRFRELFSIPAQRRWLLGEQPPAVDLLAWNADGTRLPSAMHREYLQSCYIDNLFARGELLVNGMAVGIRDITVPVYAVAGETDHIVPWQSSFKGISQSARSRRLVLVPRGHIGAIVSVGSRASFLVGPDVYVDDWEAQATRVNGSWWGDWTRWLGEYSGKRIAPITDEPDMGSAPGMYVFDSDPGTYELS